jgi:hypothetical protein
MPELKKLSWLDAKPNLWHSLYSPNNRKSTLNKTQPAELNAVHIF